MAHEKIYQHLQILLFVLVGGFFVTQIGANKLQAYLENRGESSAKEPYLHKFYIPLLMVGTFFMPIPEANGMAHSTIVQNVIRSFTMINELFIFLSVEQFSGIETSWYNFHTNFITGAITGLLMIFGTLASGYIMWKLIVSGPAWTLSLVGIDGKQDDVIASGIESNLAKRAFVA
ncbi:hypothetical protein [Helicobacter fennelliae]|nr:hypothetical protein [Helicobacter fennelliae]STP07387.1 Uncharacterised protein [Helicobacter fennelliae]